MPLLKNKENANQIMTTTEYESSTTVAVDVETWNLARNITESRQEAEDLVQDICHKVSHFPDNEQSIAVMMHVNLLASKVMTRH